ncbi:MAG TPA: ATP-binding protein [Verrucomicrobiae bacterium]|nr:ATP-binding protein [Verrucomicrobiae bacterium]
MFRNLSIKRKQMLIITLTSTVALLLASSAFIYYEIITFRNSVKENLSSLADVLSYNSTAALTFNDPSVARDLLNCLSSEPHVIQAVLYNKNAQRFARYSRKQQNAEIEPPNLPPEGYVFGESSVAYGAKVQMQGEQLGWIYLEADLAPLKQRVQQYVSIVILVSLASLLAALLISSRLQRLVSDPILQLARLARMVSFEKNYSARATPASTRDEVGELIQGFNEMLEQIQTRDVALQSARDDLERRVTERTHALQQEVSERRRAEQQLQQQLTRISLLNSITRAITDRQDLESVVSVVLKQLQDNLPIDFGRVYLYDKQARMITVAGHHETSGSPDTRIFTRQAAIESVGLTDCLEGKPVIWQDMRGGQLPLQERLVKAHLHSAIAVPLMVESELFGVLLVARRDPNAFGSGECEFLRMLSEHVALAAHQARLHTQLQSAYDELRQTQQAVMQQERLRALGQMASGIAHDINNALCPIVVYSDMLLQKGRNLEDETCKYLKNIKTAGEDISHIVSRMREFYRRRDGKDALALINLNRVAEQVIELTRPRWRDIPQARGVTIEMELDLDDKVPEIPGIESELREAITNLILNAVDALPNGGRLKVRTRSRGGDEKKAPAFAMLEVRDNGTGMSEEVRRRCLEPFFSTKGKRGTGLGLAMVYGIMERHEGRIEIDSTYGKGTTMRLVFPVRDLPAASPQKSPRPNKPLPAMRLLCVDDEPLLREMMKQILESGGHTVEVADGGESGLAAFRAALEKQEPFDVVITDLGMPYLDGRQLSRTIKGESPDTPIVMLTGWGTIMKEDGDMPAQVDGVLSKPPKIAELYAMLGKVSKKAA